jgi:putative ABC transport system permease protein
MRLHSLFLYLYPSSFRSEYAEELARIFRQRRATAGGPLAVGWLLLSEFVDILINAACAHWDILRQDLRYTLRTLLRSPGFALAAVLVTGLGIGATTAAYSITDHALVHPLAFTEPDRLVQLWQSSPGYTRFELSPPNFYDWRKQSRSYESMSAYTGIASNFLAAGESQRLPGTAATAEFFKVLRVQPLLGRLFMDADLQRNAPRVVILSYAFWQSNFGGSASVLQTSIRLDNESYSVIGVMPPDFVFPSRDTRMWTPLVLGDPPDDARDNLFIQAIARLKPGVELDQARAEMSGIAAGLALQYPKENDKVGAVVDPLRDQVPAQTRSLLWALFGASFCVLLIACTNLANLLLAKAMARRKELTVRAAIGAGRERLVRQLLTESVMLAVAGGITGVVVAAAGLPLLADLVPASLPIARATVLDQRVFAFAALVTLATGFGFGVLPAWRLYRGMNYEGLKEGSRAGVGGRRERMRSVLVIAEITSSIVLLVSAGLLIRALWRIQAIDPGFHVDSVVSMQTWLPMPRYSLNSARIPFYTQVLSNVRALPGVTNAAYISSIPMIPGGGIWPVAVPGAKESEGSGGNSNVGMRVVSPGYFDALGIPLRAGRDIRESDSLDAPQVVVVSESFARKYWPNQDPIGRKFHFALSNFTFAEQDKTIVGVVGDVRFRGLERRSEPQVYLASRQIPDETLGFYVPRELVIRYSSDAATLLPAVRKIIRAADPEMPIPAVRSLRDVVNLQTAPRSTQIRLVAAFAALAIILAGIGIHGLLSFVVGQRSPEFGLRIALGAQSRDILSMVLREGVMLAGIGTVVGLVFSYFAGRSMEALLAGVGPFDPLTVLVSCIVVVAITLTGSMVPAIRAMRTDPTLVIRGQ